MPGWLVETIVWFLGMWPYWVPILTFSIGASMATRSEREKSEQQLTRLARGIKVPDGWRSGRINSPLDGSSLSKEQMAMAALVIRTPDGGHGSGVCISSSGLVLTNAHVVGSSKTLEVEHEGNSYLGIVLKRNTKRDVAVLLVGATDLMSAMIAGQPAKVGDDLYVSGTPLSLENRNMLTRGVVSKVGMHEKLNYIFMDAHIAPGNSGGPVFNSDGQLVGISVAVQRDPANGLSYIGMAIPINDILDRIKIALLQ